jgi:5-methylcytosine-specific restriction endonuclease McrA
MAAKQLTPEERERLNAYNRAWRAQRSPEEKERVKAERREYMRQRALDATPEQKAATAERMRQWNAANKERKSKYMRERYPSKRAQILANEKMRYANPEVKARTIAAATRRYAEKREDVLAAQKKRRNGPRREAILAAAREWGRNNHEQRLAHARNRHALKRSRGRHTAADVRLLFEAQRGLCADCGGVLAKTGPNKFHVDHIMPLALGGSNSAENIQLLHKPCNLSKGKKHPDAWAAERGRLFA